MAPLRVDIGEWDVDGGFCGGCERGVEAFAVGSGAGAGYPEWADLEVCKRRETVLAPLALVRAEKGEHGEGIGELR